MITKLNDNTVTIHSFSPNVHIEPSLQLRKNGDGVVHVVMEVLLEVPGVGSDVDEKIC